MLPNLLRSSSEGATFGFPFGFRPGTVLTARFCLELLPLTSGLPLGVSKGYRIATEIEPETTCLAGCTRFSTTQRIRTISTPNLVAAPGEAAVPPESGDNWPHFGIRAPPYGPHKDNLGDVSGLRGMPTKLWLLVSYFI